MTIRKRPAARRAKSSLRIIGGEWRGRRVPIADAPGLRPTPDRIRETLFNWLASRIAGACCLDLFAGTGALGLEALSRGAAHVHFVDSHRTAVTVLRTALDSLGAGERALVTQSDVLAQPETGQRVEIVFIDPPFGARLHAAALATLSGRLAPNARIYLEYPAGEQDTIAAALNEDYAILRAKRAGGVGYCLAQPALYGDYTYHG